MRRIFLILGALAAVALSGCTSDSSLPVATGKGTVRAINAIKTSPQIAFLIEERVVNNVDYKSSTGAEQYDDLEYTFNIDVVFPVTGRRRIASQFLNVIKDKDYSFVVSGTLAAPTITLWESDSRTFADTDTVFEARFGHTAATLGDIDVYFAAPGVAPALGQAVGTLSFGDVLPAVDYPEGDYVLVLTQAGDPAMVLFTSGTIAPTVRTAFTISLFDGDANDLGPVAVRVFDNDGATIAVTDTSLAPTVRFFHASMALATSDIYDDEMLTSVIVTEHAFGDISADIPAVAGLSSFTYTAAGDTGSILFEDDVTFATGSRNQYYVIGETGALTSIATIPDRRSVETLVKFSFLQAAANHGLVDVYLLEADTNIADGFPSFFSVPFGTGPLSLNLLAGSFDLYMTAPGETTVIAGPFRLDVALGDVAEVIAYDTVDPATATMVLIPQP